MDLDRELKLSRVIEQDSSPLTNDERLKFAFDDILRSSTSKLGRFRDHFRKTYADFTKIKQETYTEMRSLQNAMNELGAHINQSNAQNGTTANALAGFRNVFVKDIEIVYHRLNVLGMERSKLSKTIKKFRKLRAKIRKIQTNVDKFRTNDFTAEPIHVPGIDAPLSVNHDLVAASDKIIQYIDRLDELEDPTTEEQVLKAQVEKMFSHDWNSHLKSFKELFVERDIIAHSSQDSGEKMEKKAQRYLVDISMAVAMMKIGCAKSRKKVHDEEEKIALRRRKLTGITREIMDLENLPERSDEDEVLLQRLKSRQADYRNRIEQSDNSGSRHTLIALETTFENFNARYITLRNEVWSDPETAIGGRIHKGPLALLRSESGRILTDILYFLSDFRAVGKDSAKLMETANKKDELETNLQANLQSIANLLPDEPAMASVRQVIGDAIASYQNDVEMGNLRAASEKYHEIKASINKLQARATALEKAKSARQTQSDESLEPNLETIRQQVAEFNRIHGSITSEIALLSPDIQQIFSVSQDRMSILMEQVTAASDTALFDPQASLRKVTSHLDTLKAEQQKVSSLILTLRDGNGNTFRNEFLAVGRKLEEAQELLDNLMSTPYDPKTCLSRQAKLTKLKNAFNKCGSSAQQSISAARNTLTKAWFNRNINAKVDSLLRALQGDTSRAERITVQKVTIIDYNSPDQTTIQASLYQQHNFHFILNRSPLKEVNVRYTMFNASAAQRAIEHLKAVEGSKDKQYRKAQIEELTALLKSLGSLDPEMVRQNIFDNTVRTYRERIHNVYAEDEPNVGYAEELRVKAEKEIVTYLQNMDADAKFNAAQRSEKDKNDLMKGVALAQEIAIAIARIALSHGLDILGWCKLVKATINLVVFIIDQLRNLMDRMVLFSVEMLKLHQRIANNKRRWVIDLVYTINGSLTATRKELRGLRAAIFSAESQVNGLNSNINDLLDKTQQIKNSLRTNEEVTGTNNRLNTRQRRSMVSELARTEAKTRKLLENCIPVSQKLHHAKELIYKSNTDLDTYEKFLNRWMISRKLGELAEDPEERIFLGVGMVADQYSFTKALTTGEWGTFENICNQIGEGVNTISGLLS